VSFLIGRKGQQVEQIQNSTGTEVSVGNKIRYLQDRVTKIYGRPKDIKQAAEKIYRLILEKKPSSPERKVKFTQLPLDKLCIRFAMPTELLGSQKEFLRRLEDSYVEARAYTSEPESIIVSLYITLLLRPLKANWKVCKMH